MSPIPSFPTTAQRSRTLRLLGSGATGALATLMLLSGCGTVTDPSTDVQEPAGSSEVAAADVEPAEESSSDPTGTDPEAASTATPAAAAEPAEATSSEESTPEPAPAPEPVEAQSFSGTGAEVVMLEPLGEDVFFATVTHHGSGNVALWSVDENGQDLDLMVNEIGSYEGQVALNFREDPAAIRVEADGDWTIELVHLGEAPRWDGDSAYEGSGDSIVIVDGVADGLTPVTLTHDGESNFAIWAWGESYPDLIVNDIGAYDGTTLLPDGSMVLQVDADGTWTIAKD
ncbi:hypothetical protein CFK38_07610 [Brachybacterium vulturis]|uniref:Uncharacterized protein n=1 Tax=Brachybacterium vulturis TaxID=2017484 RepID=A0A291GML4_9MICO|nr:hypothetical protein [Brachybacterium vulturis]ATG51407.1 hypothetical protein CFK38_07610 [Brachybacterium vulturis]